MLRKPPGILRKSPVKLESRVISTAVAAHQPRTGETCNRPRRRPGSASTLHATIPLASPTPTLLHSTVLQNNAALSRIRLTRTAAALLALTLATIGLHAQGSSSSSSGGTTAELPESTSGAPRIAQQEVSGSSITLETSEPLFALAAALNTCGYDADLASSTPVRAIIRTQVATAAAATPEAQKSRTALCAYIRQHTLGEPGRNLAQYISLALYTSPTLTPTVDETELPPDSTQIVNILPLLRTFSEETHLHAIWIEHRAEYAALVDKLHDPLSRMILNTNVYLHLPVSSYDGRRFLVLVEPMLAPSAVNARIYGSNYIIAVSPTAAGSFHLEQIRHTYLHYEVEPMIYARASAMERLQPLLKTVADAPIEFSYKSDVVSLITECLIKAIEARTMDTGIEKPAKPTAVRQRADMEHYDAAMGVYERQVEAVRRNAADAATHHGWILTNYFYNELINEERANISLKDNIAQMVYGMDVDRQRHTAQQLTFTPDHSAEPVHHTAAALTGLRLAELKLMQGDAATAQSMADKALLDPAADHAEANYLLARINLLEQQPDQARNHFQAALAPATNRPPDLHAIAWSHIYLGRLYDVQADRHRALQEYQAALNTNDPLPDTHAAAATGLKTPFALPRRDPAARPGTPNPPTADPQSNDDDDNTPIDPSGKAEKEAYKPAPSK